ncbi:MAG: NAD(P)H-dependent glycerol-3-phosphate dehydrogenase [Thiothrix litoralis]
MENNKTLRVAVFGSTTMGTALAHLMASAGHACTLLTADPSVVEAINVQHRHAFYFDGLSVHPAVHASSDLAAHIPEANMVVMAVPSHAMREAARQLGPLTHAGQSVLSATKGFEPVVHKVMTQVLREECHTDHIGNISGPNIALDMLQGLPTTLLIASDSAQMRQHGQQAFASPNIHIVTSADLASHEYTSALKNIVAIEVGLATGWGLGNNFRALVMAEGMAELSRLLQRMGLDSSPLYTLAGISDIFLTCSSQFAHNYTIGVKMGEGALLEDLLEKIKARGEMAEGVESLKAGFGLVQQFGQPSPLLEAAHAIAFRTRPVEKEEFIEAAFKRNTAGH